MSLNIILLVLGHEFNRQRLKSVFEGYFGNWGGKRQDFSKFNLGTEMGFLPSCGQPKNGLEMFEGLQRLVTPKKRKD